MFGLPEETEGKNCSVFLKNFFKDHLEIENVELERAHRTPTFRDPQKISKPRPILMAFLRHETRQQVLKAAVKLKSNPVPNAKVIIAEDLSKKLQGERKKLLKKRYELLQERPGRKVYINYPAVLRIAETDGSSRRIRSSEIK